MSLSTVPVLARARSFPRVSGDEPTVGRTPHFFAEFSPRERG